MASTLIEINTKYPINFFVDDSAEDFYGKAFWIEVQSGLYELNQISEILEILCHSKEIPKFIDIGSSCGLYSLIAGSLGAEVLSFEPDADQFKALLINSKLNPKFKIKAIRALIIGNAKSNLSSYALDLDNNNLNEISKISVDNLFENSANFLIKCDIEGGEWGLLRSRKFKHKLKNLKRVDFFLSIHIGFYSKSYSKSYFHKTIYRINYLRELFTLVQFAKSANEIFYGGRPVSPWALVRIDRIFGGSGFTNHLHLVFRDDH